MENELQTLRRLRPRHPARRLPALLATAAVASSPWAWSAGAPDVEPRIASAVGEPLSAAGFTPAGRAVGLHAPTTAYNHGDPTPQEQLMLELVNRARANPPAEAARFGMDLNENLPPDTISPDPKPPLAFHPHLIAAARVHSDWMLAADVFSHDGENGSTPGDRMAAAGYVFSGSWTWGENIAWQGTTGTPNPTRFTVDMHEGLFRSPGHRLNILGRDFDEIGVGIRSGVFTVRNGGENRDYNAVMATQNFARSASTPAPLVLGVVFRDANGDQAYSAGEGLAGVTVTPSAGSAYAVTSGSGGFAFPAPATSGTLTVTITGPGLAAPLSKTVGLAAVNVKLDFEVNGEPPLTFVPGSAGFDAQKRFRFELAGPNGTKARVEHSADLVTWQTLGTYTLNGGKASVTDNSGSQSRRLYRAVLVP
jgi:hypothetical protein